MAYNFKKKAQDITTLSFLMEGRSKIETEDLIRSYKDGITVTGVDIQHGQNDAGETVDYPVITFAEDDAVFYFGGTVLAKIVKGWIADFDGDAVACTNELKASGGVKVQLAKGKTKDGKRTIITAKVID